MNQSAANEQYQEIDRYTIDVLRGTYIIYIYIYIYTYFTKSETHKNIAIFSADEIVEPRASLD